MRNENNISGERSYLKYNNLGEINIIKTTKNIMEDFKLKK